MAKGPSATWSWRAWRRPQTIWKILLQVGSRPTFLSLKTCEFAKGKASHKVTPNSPGESHIVRKRHKNAKIFSLYCLLSQLVLGAPYILVTPLRDNLLHFVLRRSLIKQHAPAAVLTSPLMRQEAVCPILDSSGLFRVCRQAWVRQVVLCGWPMRQRCPQMTSRHRCPLQPSVGCCLPVSYS